MAEKSYTKIWVPLTIGAAVIGIYAALRKSGPNVPLYQPTQPQPAPPTGYGALGDQNAIPATPLITYGLPDEYAGVPIQGVAGTNPTYNYNAGVNPLSASPFGPAPLSGGSYLTYNVPPWLGLQKFLAAQAGIPGASASGSCGSCGGNSNACGCAVPQNPSLPDGHGGCLTVNPPASTTQVRPQAANLASFSTSPYNCNRPDSPFDLNCQGLLYSPATSTIPNIESAPQAF